MIKHGVLMKTLEDGTEVPAGHELMNKDTLRIALVEADDTGRFPASFDAGGIDVAIEEKLIPLKQHFNIGPTQFPATIRDIVTRAITDQWFEGEIEFVSLSENPDLQIAAFNSAMLSGLGTHPPADETMLPDELAAHDNITIPRIPTMLLSIDTDNLPWSRQPQETVLYETVSHEFGHNLGVFHPFSAVERVIDTKTGDCTLREVVELQNPDNPGIMSYGPEQETWYDVGTRDFVKTGQPPPKP